MNITKLLLSIFSFFVFGHSIGQTDTLFWFAAPDISTSVGESPVELLLFAKGQNATVTIDIPANGLFTPIVVNVTANSSQTIDLTPHLGLIESAGANSANDNGLRIQSTELISASYLVNSAGNKELFVLKGTKGLGQNFYTPFQENLNINGAVATGKSTIEIVATEDNTTVLITPRTDVVGHIANSTFSVTLNEGQTFTVADTDNLASTSLSGSIVASDKDISVTISEDAIEQSTCTSSIGDQLVSLDNVGRKYAVSKGSASTDYLVVLATENATQVSLTNSGTNNYIINWGETIVLPTTETLNYIESNKPIYLLHVSGNGCETSAALVPSMVCSGGTIASFLRPSADDLSVFLYTFAGFESQFSLNGSTGVINAGDFQPVPGTSGQFVAGLISIPLGSVASGEYFTIENNASFGMGVYSEQSGGGSFYGFPSEYKTENIVDAGPDQNICANVALSLNGSVGGGSVTGNWTTSGYGVFSGPSTDLTNVYFPNSLDTIVSPIRFVLSSTGECPIVRDTVLVNITPEPIMNAGVDQTLCMNNATAVLQGTAEAGTTTGVWSTLGDGTFIPSNTDLNATYEPGTNDITNGSASLTLTSTGANTCLVVEDQVELTYASGPTVVITPDTIQVCENNATISLSGSVTGFTTTGKWTTQGSGIFSPNNLSLVAQYTPTPTEINSGGIYIYLSSTNNGICNEERDSVYIEFTNQPTIDAGADIILCANTPEVSLSGNVTGSTGVQWSGGTGVIDNPNNSTTTYQPTAAEINLGSVTFTIESTGNGSCIAVTDQVEVNFIQNPIANFSATSVCFGESTEFTDISLPVFGTINSWEWNFGNGNTSSDQNNTFSFTSAGQNSVELIVTTDANCSDTVTQNVEVYESPVADFSEVISCTNSQIIANFSDESTSADPINYWYYDFGGIGTVAVPDPIQVFPPNANYTILHIVRTTNGCEDTIQKTIEIPALPVAGFSYNADNSPTVGAVYNFVDTSLNTTDMWWVFDNTAITEQNPTQTYFSNGIYYVTQFVTNEIGCMDSVQKPIVVDIVTKEISALIPDAISPNNDGYNDVWELDFIDLLYPEAKVTILNQWGQVLFESEGYSSPWDGTFNGQDVADGNYFYVIELNDPKEQIFKGVLLVLKTR